jgi:hypothetical protein
VRAPRLLDRRSPCHRADRPPAQGPGRRQAEDLAQDDAGLRPQRAPAPGAQLTLFETADGWRYTLWATNLPGDTRGWRGQCAYIDAGHRVHARVEDVIRTGKDTGLGHFPSRGYGLNKAWLDASMTACILLSWLRHLTLDGKLAKAEPRTLRYLALPHRRPARPRRAPQDPQDRRLLAWADAIITAWTRIQALPHPT